MAQAEEKLQDIDANVVEDNILPTVKETGTVSNISHQAREEVRAVSDISQRTIEKVRAVPTIIEKTGEVHSVTMNPQQSVEEAKAVRYISQQIAEEASTITDNIQQPEVKTSAIADYTHLTVEGTSVIADNSQQTVEASVTTDNTQLTVEEASVIADNTQLTVEEASVIADNTQLTIEEASVIADNTQLTVEASVIADNTLLIEESSVIADNTPLAEEASVIVDNTQLTIEASVIASNTQLTVKFSALSDMDDQTAEESRAVRNENDSTVEEASAVRDMNDLTAEEASAVRDMNDLTAEEASAVRDMNDLTAEEASAVRDMNDLTAEKASAVKDMNGLTVEDSDVPDVTLQTTEEEIAIKDDTRETKELLTAFRDIAQQTTKEPNVVRDTSQRRFGYVKVLWEIENFFFATKNEVWEISSPEFDVEGSFVTRWRLILKVQKSNEGNNRDAYICLERLNGGIDAQNIRVCWNVWYKIAGEKVPLCNKENLMKNNCVLAAPIKNFELFIRSLQFNPMTIMSLDAFILVRGLENGVVFKTFEDLGVKRLSKDLSLAYSISQRESDVIEYESLSDFKINTEGYPLICHKSVVSARNKVISETIDKNARRSEIDFDFSTGIAGKKIFRYLYSGDLTHILNLPSISIDKAINYLGMDELKCYYLKDSIHLHTRFEAEEMYFKWVVTDLNENFLFSPIFSRENSGLALRLRFGLYKDFPRAPFLSLKLDVIENDILEFHFICGIANNNGQIVNRRAMRWTSGCEAEIINFASKSVLRDSSIIDNGHLSILCSIFIPKGTQYQSVVKTQKCLRPELDQERHHRLLSKELIALFETGKHADLYIKCQEEIFKVHKCIVFARSPVFRRAIRAIRDKDESITGFSMNEFDPKIVRTILRYIYSGLLNCEKEDLLAVYEGSKKLSMVTLQNQVFEILLNNLDVSNSIEMLELAVKYADFRLVEPVCHFMKKNLTEISLQKNWETFLQEKESLYERLQEYARCHSKVFKKV